MSAIVTLRSLLIMCTLCSIPILVGSHDQQINHLWQKVYTEIFGYMDVPTLMSDRQLLWSMMFLHDNAKSLASKSVGADQIERVEFWYDAIVDDDVNHCNPNHLIKMRAHFDKHNDKKNPNFQEVFKTSRKNTMELCCDTFKDLPAKISEKNVPESGLKALLVTFIKLLDTEPEENIIRKLQEPVMKLLKIKGKKVTGQKLIEAWNRGPCSTIFNLLEESNMKSYSDFVDMSLIGSIRALDFCSKSTKEWLLVIDMCGKLDDVIPVLAASKNPSKSTVHKIKECFNKRNQGSS